MAFSDVLELLPSFFPKKKPALRPLDTREIDLIWQNNSFAVLSKPGNISMHPVAGKKGGPTVSHAVLARYPEAKGVGEHPERPGIVHRLDRETSGLFVIAKTKEAYEELKGVFQRRKVDKRYIALVNGNLKETEGIITAPLERSPGSLKRRISRDGNEKAREATTKYRVLIRYKDFDLVEICPKTGRTHQIRVHFSSLGHPIAGDTLYKSKAFKKVSQSFPRQMLHAYSLRFPFLKEEFEFTAPLPDDFAGVLRDIDETRAAGYDGEALKSLFSEYGG